MKSDVGSDPEISLVELKDQIDKWIELYGNDAVFSTDAGYNNVTIYIDNRKKSLKSYRRIGI